MGKSNISHMAILQEWIRLKLQSRSGRMTLNSYEIETELPSFSIKRKHTGMTPGSAGRRWREFKDDKSLWQEATVISIKEYKKEAQYTWEIIKGSTWKLPLAQSKTETT